MSFPAIKPTAQRSRSCAPRSAKSRVAIGRGDAGHRNLKASHDGALVTADARRPAPEFRHAIRLLANPPIFKPRDSLAYKRAVTSLAVCFGHLVRKDEDGFGFIVKGAGA